MGRSRRVERLSPSAAQFFGGGSRFRSPSGNALSTPATRTSALVERVALESAKPADCLTATHRQSQAGARSGFIGGPTKRTAIFEAKAPGTATVVLSSFSGAGRPWRRVGEVSVTVTS